MLLTNVLWRCCLLCSVVMTMSASEAATTDATATTRHRRREKGHSSSRSIKIINKSGVKLDAYWIHSQTGQLADSNSNGAGVPYGGDLTINSYVGHSFSIQELPDKYTNKCRDNNICLETEFTVKNTEDQVFTIWKDFQVTFEDHKTLAMKKAKTTLQSCSIRDYKHLSTVEEQIQALTDCMDKAAKAAIAETEEQIAFEAQVREEMGVTLMDYACVDEKAPLTESINNVTWTYKHPVDRTKTKRHTIQTPFDTLESDMLLVDDFLTTQQCETLLKHVGEDSNVGLKAKQDLKVLELMLKVQNLIQTHVDEKIAFNEEPLMVYTNKACGEGHKETKEECAIDPETLAPKITTISLHTPNFAVATMHLFCSSSGALHYPKTGVHIPAVPGRAILVSHKLVDEETGQDEYLGDSVLCAPKDGPSIFTLNVL